MAGMGTQWYLQVCIALLCATSCLGKNDQTAVIAGCTVAGLVVVVGIIVVVIVVIVRRKHKGETKFTTTRSVYENVEPLSRCGWSQKEGVFTLEQPSTKTSNDGSVEILMEKSPAECNEATDSMYMNIAHTPPKPVTETSPTGRNTVSGVIVSDLADHVQKVIDKGGFKEEYDRLPSGFSRPHNVSQSPGNKGKNKFTGYYPYDYNRVMLSLLPEQPHSDYINASYIDGYKKESAYIAAQAPKKKTLADFWRMIWETDCGKIVMLTNLVELTKVKCEPYWKSNKPLDTGQFIVSVAKETKRSHWVIREFIVRQKKMHKTKKVLHFHFTAWPDHGVPDVTPLVEFIWRVRKTPCCLSGPLLVHCSAGIGRTGTYLTIDYCLDTGQAENRVDIFGCVSKFRDQRKDMIQTDDQYRCVHTALVEAFTVGDTSLSCRDFIDTVSSQSGWKMGGCSLSQILQILKVEQSQVNDEERQNIGVLLNDKNDHYSVTIPSLFNLSGFYVSEIPSGANTEDFWKSIDNMGSLKLVLMPAVGKHVSRLCPASGQHKDYANISVTCVQETKLSPDAVCRKVNLQDKIVTNEAASTDSVEVYILSPTCKVDVKTLPTLIRTLEVDYRDEASESTTTVIFSVLERKLAALMCIVVNIMVGIDVDEEVEVYNNVRKVTRDLEVQITKNELEDILGLVSIKLTQGSVYTNTSRV